MQERNWTSFRQRGDGARGRLGLTALYNLVNDEAMQEDDIVQLREIHVEIDRGRAGGLCAG